MFFDFLDDSFLLYFTLETPQRTFIGFSRLQLNTGHFLSRSSLPYLGSLLYTLIEPPSQEMLTSFDRQVNGQNSWY